jgi:hypothetical protein
MFSSGYCFIFTLKKDSFIIVTDPVEDKGMITLIKFKLKILLVLILLKWIKIFLVFNYNLQSTVDYNIIKNVFS